MYWKLRNKLMSLRGMLTKSVKEDNRGVDYKNIMKVEFGQSFKGHAFSFVYGTGVLSINQSYFSGSVVQSYRIDDKTTRSTYGMGGQTPKWLVKKIQEVGIRYTNEIPDPNADIYQQYSLQINDNPYIEIYAGHYQLRYVIDTPGVGFNNHFENISELKRLGELYKSLRERIRQAPLDELVCKIKRKRYGDKVLDINKNILL